MAAPRALGALLVLLAALAEAGHAPRRSRLDKPALLEGRPGLSLGASGAGGAELIDAAEEPPSGCVLDGTGVGDSRSPPVAPRGDVGAKPMAWGAGGSRDCKPGAAAGMVKRGHVRAQSINMSPSPRSGTQHHAKRGICTCARS